MAFADSLAIILRSEGGFSNNPRDKGGMTNLGVTAKAWQQWTAKPVTEAIMRALTQVKVAPFYKAWYWDKVAGDRLPPAIALCVFDFAVNAGPIRAAKLLQTVVGAIPDGAVGRGTLQAVQAYVTAHGLPALVRAYQRSRAEYYRDCEDFDVFGKGWLNRVTAIETEALRLT